MNRPPMSINIHIPMKMAKSTFAISAAPSAMPVKPNIAATSAMIKNANDQRNIMFGFKL